MMTHTTLVIRAHQIQDIDSEDVVVGDILVLKAGDTVPADARIIRASNVKVDMSSLTGESVPAERNAERSDLSADKAKCLIFKGSAITSGECEAIVIRVGHATLIGAIMTMSMGQLVEEGELGHEITILIRRIVLAAAITGFLFMGVAFIQGLDVIVAFEVAIGIFVAFLPQGLPMTITILLTSAAKRMAAKNVLVKSLQAVETLGSLTVIATDKTGTLTKNQMEVIGAWIEGNIYDDIHQEGPVDGMILDCFCGATTVKVDFNKPIPQDLAGISADATEMGLFKYALARKFDFAAFFESHSRKHDIPFDSVRKWNLTVMKFGTGWTVYLKGAPDKILQFCNGNEEVKEAFNHAYGHFASQGQRVIGFASKHIEASDLPNYQVEPSEVHLEAFSFLGMLSIYDPPKKGVLEAVQQLRDFGIRVFMVTGDHPITAQVSGNSYFVYNVLGYCEES